MTIIIIIISYLVCRLYTVTHVRLSSLMSLFSSCLGVKYASKKPLFTEVRIKYSPPPPLCQNLCLQLKNTMCKNTREYNKERGQGYAPDGNTAVPGMMTVDHWKARHLGEVRLLFPLGCSLWANMGQKDQQTDWHQAAVWYDGSFRALWWYSCFISVHYLLFNVQTTAPCFPAFTFFILSICFNDSTVLGLS